MKTYFERRNYLNGFIICWLICTITGLVASYCLFDGLVMLFCLVLSILFGVVFVGYDYRRYCKILEGVESVSNQMDLILSDERIVIADVHKEGSIGILYSNFEKLVRMLQEGKQREEAEKIFLKEIMSDISHQLKTPLASLRFFMDLLIQEQVPDV